MGTLAVPILSSAPSTPARPTKACQHRHASVCAALESVHAVQPKIQDDQVLDTGLHALQRRQAAVHSLGADVIGRQC